MSKLKIMTGIGIFAGGLTIAGMEQQKNTNLESSTPSTKLQTHNSETPITKRSPSKVYHRFEEIPNISDTEANLYSPNEYTYIINADKYQKNGQIELKRVLKQELTQANIFNLVYRTECHSYTPKPNEDQLSKYIIDLKVLSKTGIYKGPSQMDDEAIVSFIKYLVANPKTREYVLPLINTNNQTTTDNTSKLEHYFFDKKGNLRPMDEREAILNSPAYKKIKIQNDAWKTIASPNLIAFFANEEARMSKKNNTTVKLTNITKNYLCLTELFPNEQLLKQEIENYNIAFYQLGRSGKTKHITAALSRSLNLKDSIGNLDATRLPSYAISATICHINWKGNGRQALKDAQDLRKLINKNPNHKKNILLNTAKQWVSGKSRTYGVDEMSKFNILTPKIIHQYLKLEIPGSKNLFEKYHNAVKEAESQINSPEKATTQELSPIEKGKTLLLTAIDFIRNR